MMKERMCIGPEVDAIKYYQEKLDELTPQVNEERKLALEEANTPGGVNTSTGFVTFKRRRQAIVCMHTVFSKKLDEWAVSAAPPATDILWNDLKQDAHTQKFYTFLAYFAIVSLYILFIPIVVIGTNLTMLIDLGPYFQPLFASF